MLLIHNFVYIDYGDIFYMHASTSTLKPLDLVYHSASWFITDDSFLTRPCILFDRGIVLLSNRAQHFMIFIYSSVLHRLTAYLNVHTLTLTVPLPHSELGKTRFKYFGSYNKPQKTLKLQSLISLGHYWVWHFLTTLARVFFLNLWSSLICCFILYL